MVALAKGLAARGHAVSIVTFYDDHAIAGLLGGSSVEIVSLQKGSRWDVAGPLARLVSMVRSWRPDVIHSYLEIPNVVAICLKPLFSCPVVCGVRTSNYDVSGLDGFIRLSLAVHRRLLRFCDVCICNSEIAATSLRDSGRSAVRTEVVPNGIDTKRFTPDAAARRGVREEWGAGSETRVIGCVARLDPIKGHDVMLRAAAIAMEKEPDLLFVCVGAGSPRHQNHLTALASKLEVEDRVRWVPSSSSVERLDNGFDIFTLASRAEGFPNALAEAMACGVPPVATDVGDVRSIVGDVGIVVPLQDPRALSSAWLEMLGALDADGAAIRAAARSRVVDNFGVDVMVTRTEAILKSVV